MLPACVKITTCYTWVLTASNSAAVTLPEDVCFYGAVKQTKVEANARHPGLALDRMAVFKHADT